jgi:undecaprenyl-diphosphatase
VLVPWLFGWNVDPAFAFAFDVLVQMGTLVAVIVFYASTLARMVRAVVSGCGRRPFADPALGWRLGSSWRLFRR